MNEPCPGPVAITITEVPPCPACEEAIESAVWCAKMDDGRVTMLYWDSELAAFRVQDERELYVVTGDELRKLRSMS